MVSLDAESMLSESFFRELLPSLTFGGTSVPATRAIPVPHFRSALIQRGFIRQTASETWGDAVPTEIISALHAGVCALSERKLPLSLISVSREAQTIAAALRDLLAMSLGGAHICIGDWAFFYVDAESGGKGWAPHRDRMRHTGAIQADGTPSYVTCWLPLSSASSYTSCLYVVPRSRDPGYETGDEDPAVDPEAKDATVADSTSSLPKSHPLSRAFSTPEAWQSIVALPTGRGGLVCFSSRTLHWGSAPLAVLEDEPPRAPRVALSIAFAVPEFEQPALARAGACESPTFTEAAVLAAAQALIYHTQAPLSSEHARACVEVLQGRGGDLLEASFRARALKAGNWACFTQKLTSALGAAGPPSHEAVSLAFAALAAADAGFGAAMYL